MRRFFTDAKALDQDLVTLTGEELHHLKNVTRLEEGEWVELLDGAGHIAKAEILKLDKNKATLRVLERRGVPPVPNPKIEIVLCLPSFQKMNTLIQKLVELNAFSVTPVVSDRSFIKKLSRDIFSKVDRWKKISTEACKQSGRAWPLIWGEPSPLRAIVENRKRGLFLYEGETALNIKTALGKLSEPPEILSVFIGAEGGFSPQEVSFFRDNNLEPVTLGPLVLRVETACITILSVIQYHFGQLRG